MDAGERRSLREWLTERGATAEQVARAEAEGHLPGLAAELVLSEGAALSAHDVAARVGIDVKDVTELFHRFGVTVTDLDAPRFTTVDVHMCAAMCRKETLAMEFGDLSRVVAASMDRIAEAAVALYVQGPEAELRRTGADAVRLAEKTALATGMALDLGTALGVLFRHHMSQAIARQQVITEGVSRRELARLAIGFVDLVGSTSIEADLAVDELAALVNRFESLAFDVVTAGGGRLVKFIGDEIMVAALDPLTGCRVISALVAAFAADGLRPRAGLVYGEVLYRHGDYYGPVVNLAARLVDEAIPHEVLVDRSVVGAIAEATTTAAPAAHADVPVFEPAGRRLLKGFDEPVTVWSLDLS